MYDGRCDVWAHLDAFSRSLSHSPDMLVYIFLLIILNDSKPHIYKLKQPRVNNMNINSNCMYCVAGIYEWQTRCKPSKDFDCPDIIRLATKRHLNWIRLFSFIFFLFLFLCYRRTAVFACVVCLRVCWRSRAWGNDWLLMCIWWIQHNKFKLLTNQINELYCKLTMEIYTWEHKPHQLLLHQCDA